ncbi:Mediator of RNA polymerase II transcription subunit 5 [Rasamsonia emersonii CBS 393.64]|uniref:Mediator of RNA polymerase II transcription subunit 5 n=1 Tax=Rasamsonia emersonii (strain ATCC 16479 / CBS 393.64 / IMI 116815) TaxID=1408163 RepID=A0A0F4Z6U7_RASE3|nr:Mediator of RNA polymerase II transcription subunit 5 [Rasamsonia emersonii CBS 393.64]KKA25603.1 Mediator of RNA polymerase II transcription subunit 5 [Rasamsonia emersonii CBS 393.64]
MGSSVEEWRKLLHQCLIRRIDANEFKTLAKLLARRAPLAEASLLDVVLESRAVANAQWDPLVPLYVDTLTKLGTVRIPTVLQSLLKHSSIGEQQQQQQQQQQSAAAPDNKQKSRGQHLSTTLMTDTRIIQDAMIALSTGSVPISATDAARIFTAVADWILEVVRWHTSHVNEDQQTGGLMGSPDAISLFESLGILLAALSATEKGLEALSSDNSEAFKIKLGQALTAYLPLCAGVSVPLRNRLDSLQKGFELYGEPNSKSLDVPMMDGVNVNALQFEASVMDGPVINSRAGLYIYLNAMGHHEVLIQELITASFDVLSNAMYRNESSRTMFVFRSFLVNKLPPFLASMAAASMEPIQMEVCISHALNRLDPNAFPSFSQMFEMHGNTVLSDVRQEFLFACALHRLIPESSIERLLGENPMQTLPVGGKYIKDELVSQITADHERADQLIAEMEAMEGNAAAIVGAVTEVIHSLCNQKETVTLKTICNSLSRRPQVLDVILLFRSPKTILQPLCSLLDAWRWDEDQGENQPVYDEFGSVLLLVLAFKYRYDLSQYDLGISNSQSFVLKLLDRGSSSQKLDDLGEKQHKNLGAWISALFIAEGISEETMSSCSPQEFYLLVSTLFSQSIGACEAGKLEFDTLKGGFEYLLEPFLLPSLVIALTWLGNYIWESETDPTIPLKVLHSLVKPNSISGEAEAIHRTVLYITARTLEEQLKDVRTRHPGRSDIKPILDALEPYLSFQRTGSSHRAELESWTSHSGGLTGSIRNTFHSLVLWSTNPEISMSPHSYTHRQLLAGVRILGATRVLPALIEELKLQTEAGSGDLAIDIAATLICSPMAESFAVDQAIYRPVDPNKEALPRCPILTLRDALVFQHENVPKIAEKDPLRAEVIVRLYRRVNALLAPPSHVNNLDVSNIIDNMNLEGGVGGHDQMDLGSADPQMTGTGMGGSEENIDRMLNEAAAAAGGVNNGAPPQGVGLDGAGSGPGTGMDTSIDDMLNAADMGVGNPEFLDLDMEGMF